jgi:hypothetical protein
MPTRNLKLFLISFIMLFLEVLLIRWISTEVRKIGIIRNVTLPQFIDSIDSHDFSANRHAGRNVMPIRSGHPSNPSLYWQF